MENIFENKEQPKMVSGQKIIDIVESLAEKLFNDKASFASIKKGHGVEIGLRSAYEDKNFRIIIINKEERVIVPDQEYNIQNIEVERYEWPELEGRFNLASFNEKTLKDFKEALKEELKKEAN